MRVTPPADPTIEIDLAEVAVDRQTTASTVVAVDRSNLPPPVPRRIQRVSRSSVLNFAGAVTFALCLSVLLFDQLAPFSGPVGFVLVAYITFICAYAALVGLSEDGPAVKDAVMTVIMTSAASIAAVALITVVLYTAIKGWPALHHLNFFTQDLSGAGPTAPLNEGGIKHALVGSLWMVAIALGITAPLGITCAVYLNESRGRARRLVRTVAMPPIRP